MTTAPIFVDYTRVVLDRRQADGVRGIDHERNRFKTHIEPAVFAQKAVDGITSVDLREWLRSMRLKKAKDNREERFLDDATTKRAFALIRSAFTAAVEDDIIKANPCVGVKLKKRIDANSVKPKWSILTLEEQRAFVACQAIPYMDRLIGQFAFGSGLRQGEQFSLRLKDLHVGLDDPFVWVQTGGPKDLPPKSGKPRRVPLFGDALVAARAWLLELPTYAPENPLGLVGKPFGNGGVLKRHLAHIGIERRFRHHDMRHTCASSLIAGWWGRKWTLEEVQPLMGHSSILITQRYAHMLDSDLATAARETSVSMAKLMPIVSVIPAPPDTSPVFDIPDAPDTSRELETWFEEEAVA
jgi:integrase